MPRNFLSILFKKNNAFFRLKLLLEVPKRREPDKKVIWSVFLRLWVTIGVHSQKYIRIHFSGANLEKTPFFAHGVTDKEYINIGLFIK